MVLWKRNEVTALIDVWGQDRIQEMLESTQRNKETFEEMCAELNGMFPDKEAPFTLEQCRSKIKILKCQYKIAKEANNKSGSGRSRFG